MRLACRRAWFSPRAATKKVPAAKVFDKGSNDYDFVSVIGDGVHEIPVGPVHAGTIEPGHFRFSVVGEKVLRLEEHLGYTHKGVDKRFQGMPLTEGAKRAGRTCALRRARCAHEHPQERRRRRARHHAL